VIITLIWGLCHPLELAVSLPLAKKAGFSLLKTIIYTLVFGITWWLPVKLGVLTPESQF
jgi:zinc transporter ZupT